MTPIAPREEHSVSKSVVGTVRHEPAGDDLIELLFFAYRDFVGDPDRILTAYGFGRAHHRVLHFVDRYPGLTIAELLDILRITKQSLNRVLKDLIGQGYVVQRRARPTGASGSSPAPNRGRRSPPTSPACRPGGWRGPSPRRTRPPHRRIS